MNRISFGGQAHVSLLQEGANLTDHALKNLWYEAGRQPNQPKGVRRVPSDRIVGQRPYSDEIASPMNQPLTSYGLGLSE